MSTLADVVAEVGRGGELRAGGTDVTARCQAGLSPGPFVDLLGVPELRGIEWRADGSARIGALTTVAELAADDRLRAAYPSLAATAAGLATPQVRAAATLGGNLLQRNRCWYFRNPRFTCFQRGGSSCPARDGLHLYSVVIDQGPCVAPHASSLAMALLAHDDATVEVHGREPLPVSALYDAADATRDHTLDPAEVLLAVSLPPPTPGEGAAYHRAIGRAEAEWPLVEAVARLVVGPDDAVELAAVAVGGVARTPLRLPEVEAALRGAAVTPATLKAAADLAAARCSPLPQTRYKVGLLAGTVLEVLERAHRHVRPTG
jgi:xanthine dehydrogenase YagS FAD-binding subunit